MHTHRTQQRILSLPLHKLYRHPDNANRMSKANHGNTDSGRSQKRLSACTAWQGIVWRRRGYDDPYCFCEKQ